MYKQYVDETNMTINTIPPGMRHRNKKLYQDNTSECEDQAISAEKRTMLMIQDIGNGIHSSIQLEADFPSSYEDMSIFDLRI